MAYCTRADIEARYGVTTVSKAADLDDDQSSVKIAARIAAAIAYADEWVDVRMRDGAYVLPIASSLGAVPPTIVRLAVVAAFVWMYSARGVTEFDQASGVPTHRFAYDLEEAENDIRRIHAGQLVLDAVRVTGSTMAPAVVTDED